MDDPQIDLREYSATFPTPMGPEVERDGYVRALRASLSDERPAIVVVGPPGSGKTRLLAQFVNADPARVCSYFVGNDVWSASPDRFVWEMCRQLHPLVRSRPLPDSIAPTQLESLLPSLLGQLSNAARRSGQPYYVVIDSIDRAAVVGHTRSIWTLARIGHLRGVRFLMSAASDTISEVLDADWQPIHDFGRSESEVLLREHYLTSEQITRVHEASSGLPAYVDAVRRDLGGRDPSQATEHLPGTLDEAFHRLWPMEALNQSEVAAIAYTAFAPEPIPIESWASLSGLSMTELRSLCDGVPFMHVAGDRIEWTSSSFLGFVRRQLETWRAETEVALTAFYEDRSEDATAQAVLSTLLAQRGNYEGLRRLTASSQLSRALNVTRSVPQLVRNLHVAAEAGVSHHDAPGVAGFAGAAGVLDAAIHGISSLDTEVRCLAALTRWEEATQMAAAALLPEDRLEALASLHRSMTSSGMDPPAQVGEAIVATASEVQGELEPNEAARLAATFFDVRPEAAIDLVQRTAGPPGQWALDRMLTTASSGYPLGLSGIDLEQGSLESAADQLPPEVHALGGSAAEAIVQASRVPDAAGQLLVLRNWCSRNRHDPEAGKVVAAAFDLIMSNDSLPVSLLVLRQLSEPILGVPPDERAVLAERLRLLTDTSTHAPAVEYVRLRLIAVEALSDAARDSAALLFDEVRADIEQIPDLDTRLEATGFLLHTGRRTGHMPDRDIRVGIHGFAAAFRELLGASADHYRVGIRALRALAPLDLAVAVDLAQTLNTQERRDQATFEIILSAAVSGEGRFEDLLNATSAIVDTLYLRGFALNALLEAAASHASWDVTSDMEALRQAIEALPDPNDRSRARSSVAVALLKEDSEEARRWATEAASDCASPEDPWRRHSSAAAIVPQLARVDPSLAERLYEEHVGPKEGPASLDPWFGPLFSDCLVTVISAFGALDEPTEHEYGRIKGLIDVVPSPSVQARLFAQLAVRSLAGRNLALGDLAVRELSDLAARLEDTFALAGAATYLVPVLWGRDTDLARRILSQVPQPAADLAMFATAVYQITGLPMDVPFDYGHVPDLAHPAKVREGLSLASEIRSDALLYSAARLVAVTGTRSRGVARRNLSEYAADIRVLAALLPVPGQIEHEGYRVLTEACALRLERHSLTDPRARPPWGPLANRARAIPNVADRVLVCAELASLIDRQDRALAKELFETAAAGIDHVPNALDRIGRLQHLAHKLGEFGLRAAAFDAIHRAVGMAKSADVTPENEDALARIVDVADRLDPNLGREVSEELERHLRLHTARDRREILELRRRPEAIATPQALDRRRSRHVAEAAHLSMASLSSGRVDPVPEGTAASWLRQSMWGSFLDIVSVCRWALETARRGRWSAAKRVAMFESQLDVAELVLLIGAAVRSYALLPPQQVVALTDEIAYIRTGQRETALKFIADWYAGTGDSAVTLLDPYASGEDVSIVAALVKPRLMRVITGNGKETRGQRLRTAEEVVAETETAWMTSRDDAMPTMWVSTMGTQRGRCPFHDRHLLGEVSGLEIGTSISGLGTRDSQIRVLTLDEVERIRVERGRWFITANPRLDDEVVEIDSATRGGEADVDSSRPV
jgi:hypothetical protein